jgi:radical SAM family uncharacterized protein
LNGEHTDSLWTRIEPLLASVSKPARYIGGELGAQQPDHTPGKVAWLLVYPDTYEIGLPNQGLQIIYEILNERDDALAERAYAPWVDMESAMRAEAIPLFSLESHLAAVQFDVLAFNLATELIATNVLNLIDLAGVPLRSERRSELDPLVLAGGHSAFNPEPLAGFVDAFALGDGEEVVGEMNEVLARWKAAGRVSREGILRNLARIPGVYVPSLYQVSFSGGRLDAVKPRIPDAPARVIKRTIADLAEWPYPRRQLVPLTEVVHDRLNVEVFRGCSRGCRFCQAGMITRPVRERPADQVVRLVGDGLARSGYESVSLTSLSTADFSGIEDVVRTVLDDPNCAEEVSVNLPSLRVDAFTVGLATQVERGHRGGLTFAPEGGTWRMRRVLNKLIRDEDLYAAVEAAFSRGWRRVKLYFLVGLPTETDEDVLGIAELGKACVAIGRRYHPHVTVTVSVGGLVPKAHTPFQWFGQDSVEMLDHKVGLLREAVKPVRGLSLRWHDPRASVVEGLLSRGDRRVGDVIEHVWRAGGTFQEWTEHFDLGLWQDALDACGLSLHDVVHRHRAEDEALPWDHISAGLHRDFLWQDYEQAISEVELPDCRWTPCYDCGVCTGSGLEHVVASAMPPAGGSQGTGQDLPPSKVVSVAIRSVTLESSIG